MDPNGNHLQDDAARVAQNRAAERALVDRLRAGDDAAFRELVSVYGRILYGAAHAMLGSTGDAEDAVQETLLGTVGSIGTFRGEASLKTWLLRILFRQVAKQRRTRSRKWRFLSLGAETSAEPAEAEMGDPADGVDARLDVLAMLRQLQPEHQEVLVLRELEGLSYEEMALALDVPRGTVESRLHRARAALREKFPGYLVSNGG